MRLAVAASALAIATFAGPRPAVADAAADVAAGQAFQAALERGDVDGLEQIGQARPRSRWSDDAWSEAARLALRANDFARARRALEQVIALGTDPLLVRRARAELARIDRVAGEEGRWASVAADHQRLVSRLERHDDPRAVLGELEALVRASPGYPRSAALMGTIAAAWEREGEPARAVRWMQDAVAGATTEPDRLRARIELVRMRLRGGELVVAARELTSLEGGARPAVVAGLRRDLARARSRARARLGAWALLAVLASAFALALRRIAGSWRAALRHAVRPPGEVVFLAPVAAVLVAFAYTGNPLVARAVRTILVGGVVTGWASGSLLDQHRSPPRARRVVVHAIATALALSAVAYLAIDSGALITFVGETWLAGHEIR